MSIITCPEKVRALRAKLDEFYRQAAPPGGQDARPAAPRRGKAKS